MTSFVRRRRPALLRRAGGGLWVAKTLHRNWLTYVDIKQSSYGDFAPRLFGDDILQAGRRCGGSVAVGGRWAGAV